VPDCFLYDAFAKHGIDYKRIGQRDLDYVKPVSPAFTLSTTMSILIVFDFDWSMVDQDTDRWIFEVLDIQIRRQMEDLEKKMQWTDIVSVLLRQPP
jgi:hypothetical protein